MGGYQLMIANEVFRGRFLGSFERPEPLVPDRVAEFPIDLHAADHRFLKGHRIMVQVQSTWFPLIDRNPSDFRREPSSWPRPRIIGRPPRGFHRSKAHPSRIVLPVRVR